MPLGIRLTATLQRKDPRLPVFVVIPAEAIADWKLTATTVVEGQANGFPIGRRTIKAWGRGSSDWFIEFTTSFCRQADLVVGQAVTLDLELADTSTPPELKQFLQADRDLEQAWADWSMSRRRDAGEHVRSAQRPATRLRRAERIAQQLRQDSGSERP